MYLPRRLVESVTVTPDADVQMRLAGWINGEWVEHVTRCEVPNGLTIDSLGVDGPWPIVDLIVDGVEYPTVEATRGL